MLLRPSLTRGISSKSCFKLSGSTEILTRRLILKNTKVSVDHLTPEISLRLITSDCDLWLAKPESNPFDKDPFWAFYWPGGQALTRFILDHPEVVRGKRVLEIGCGCGSASIASVKSGAKTVLANDIDRNALVATTINAKENGVTIPTSCTNFLGSSLQEWDIILLGDLLYDESLDVTDWLQKVHADVVIGDPGRSQNTQEFLKTNFTCLAKYMLTEQCQKENNGLHSSSVWSRRRFNRLVHVH